nr:diguanylate cyclase [uncultured Hyphomonas sp.]
MRLRTITNIAYAATVLLTLAGGATMLLASNALEAERAAVSRADDLKDRTATVGDDVLHLSDRAREYVVTGKEVFLEDFVQLRQASQQDEAQLAAVRDIGADDAELEALSDAVRMAGQLSDEQDAAIEAYQAGDDAAAREYLFGAHYENELDLINARIDTFHSLLDQRTANDVRAAEAVARFWRAVSEVVVLATAFIFFIVLYFVLKRRILKPVLKLSDVVSRLAAQEYDTEMMDYDTVDEIGDMAKAIRVFRENGLERQRLEIELASDLQLRNLLSRMTQRMQACDTMKEIAGVVRRFVPVIMPDCAGRLYVLNHDGSGMVASCEWLTPREAASEFMMNECWGLRRGTMHYHREEDADVPCAHLEGADEDEKQSVCIPLMAQREVVGLLYMELPEAFEAGSRTETYIQMLAENIALSLSNIRLRETLHEMAMADPLTGLSNRRRMEEKFEDALDELKRSGGKISVIMIDVDKFKKFNDTYGHAAGDDVLREVAQVLGRLTREDGLAFRYGGEEFAVLLPGVSADAAADRAEAIRREIEQISIMRGDLVISDISASFGVATTPDHGSGEGLFGLADAALYSSKASGRNRVTVATSQEDARIRIA